MLKTYPVSNQLNWSYSSSNINEEVEQLPVDTSASAFKYEDYQERHQMCSFELNGIMYHAGGTGFNDSDSPYKGRPNGQRLFKLNRSSGKVEVDFAIAIPENFDKGVCASSLPSSRVQKVLFCGHNDTGKCLQMNKYS